MSSRSVTHSEAAVFEALADRTRRAVLDLLRGGGQPAGRIAAAFDVSRPAISKHLRRLRHAALVREHRDGRHRVYELTPAPLQIVDSWLNEYRGFWRTKLMNLKSFVEAEQAKGRRRRSPVERRRGKSGRSRR